MPRCQYQGGETVIYAYASWLWTNNLVVAESDEVEPLATIQIDRDVHRHYTADAGTWSAVSEIIGCLGNMLYAAMQVPGTTLCTPSARVANSPSTSLATSLILISSQHYSCNDQVYERCRACSAKTWVKSKSFRRFFLQVPAASALAGYDLTFFASSPRNIPRVSLISRCPSNRVLGMPLMPSYHYSANTSTIVPETPQVGRHFQAQSTPYASPARKLRTSASLEYSCILRSEALW